MSKNFVSLNDLKNHSTRDENIKRNCGNITIEDVHKEDIAIIGVSCKFAEAENLKEYWNLLVKGKECLRELPSNRKEDADKYYKYYEGNRKDKKYHKLAYLSEIDKFDYEFFNMSPSEAKLMDPKQRIFLEVAWKALEDSGYSVDKFIGTKVGIYLGLNSNSVGGYENLIEKADSSFIGNVITGNLKSIIPSRLSYILDLKGPTMVIDTACSSSLVAIHVACSGINNGDCEVALVGGINLVVIPSIDDGGDEKIGVESSDFKVKTFDDTSDGTNSGEGVAAVLIKPLYKALRDNDNIYGIIKGSAINQDGTSVGITAPNVKSQENVILDAWKNSKINPETITYIEAHGTGTKLGDPIEVKAIQSAFNKFTDKRQFCAIASVKTNIGHTDSLAGLAGLIKAILSLKNKKIPASLNFKIPNRNINFKESAVYVNDRLTNWEVNGAIRRCGVSSFGMSGTNCHVVLEEAPDIINRSGEIDKVEIMALSAKSLNSIKMLVDNFINFINEENDFNLSDVCYVANTGRRHYKYRLCLVVKDKEDLKKKIKELNLEELEKNNYGKISDIEKIKLDKLVDDNIELFNRSGKRDMEALLKISEYYKQGVDIPWEKLYQNETRKKVSIPTYPFDKKRCWFDLNMKSLDFELVKIGELIENKNVPKELEVELKSVLKKYRKYIELSNKDDKEKVKVRLTGKENGVYTSNEKYIANAWYEVTGYEEINVFDDFFDKGIDSMQAVNFLSKLRLNLNLSLTDIYEYPRIIDLAEHVEYNHENLKNKIVEIKNAFKNLNTENNLKNSSDQNLTNALNKYEAENKKYKLINVNSKNEYKNILLTGATGYLGIYILRDLLIYTNSNIYVLIRSSNSMKAEQRLKDKINYYFKEEFYSKYNKRVSVIDGDLGKEKFGLSQIEYELLSNSIDCIIHSAANVNHYGQYTDFYEINVKGTERLLSLANSGIKKDFNHISTTALGLYKKKDDGNILFSEYDINNFDDIENYYIKTKAEAEKIVVKAREELTNVNIFRVGNIVFDSDSGKFQENINNNAFYLLLQAFIKMKLMPEINISIEGSFVDYISKSIILLFNLSELNNETYHICNSKMFDITDSLAKEELGLGIEKISIDKFLDYIYENYQSDDISKYIQNIIIFLCHDFDNSIQERNSVPMRTVSEKTESILKKLDFNWVEINNEHMKKMINHCKNVNFI